MKKSTQNRHGASTDIFRFLSFTIIILFIATAASNAQASKTNFTGTWKLNEEKSELGDNGGRRFGMGTFIAKQEANLLSVENTMTNRDGETVTMNRKYTLDGKESINENRWGDSKSKASWSADKKSLTIVTVSTFNDTERTSTQVWTLKDNKTLAIESTRQGREGGEVKTTRVYDKE